MTSTLADDVAAQLGRPWSREDWACWDLVRHTERHFGWNLPVIAGALADSRYGLVRAFATHPERQNWQEGRALHGAIALMTRNDGGRDAEVHCGVYLVFDRPYVFHVDEPHATVLDPLAVVRTRGWHTLKFYGHI